PVTVGQEMAPVVGRPLARSGKRGGVDVPTGGNRFRQQLRHLLDPGIGLWIGRLVGSPRWARPVAGNFARRDLTGQGADLIDDPRTIYLSLTIPRHQFAELDDA